MTTDYDEVLLELAEDSLEITQEEMIASYLRQHPEFFLKQPDLLADLYLPHSTGVAISLVEKQVSILRQRQITLRGQLSQLISAAKQNDQLFSLTKSLVVKIIGTKDIETLCDILEKSFKSDFHVDDSALLLFADIMAGQEFSRRLVDRDDTFQRIGSLLDARQTVRGIMRPKEINFLFPNPSKKIESAAIISIKSNDEIIGALAIGSTDQQRYNHSMGTMFLDFIGAATSIRISQLLNE